MCKDCNFEKGHSSECKSKEGKIFKEVTALEIAAWGCRFGTKNRSELLMRIDKIKSML